MNFVFRVDASNFIGTGHLMRCLTLAEALCLRGASIQFICREHSGHMIELLQRKSMLVTVLPAPEHAVQGTHMEDYATFIGATIAEDAEQTIQALNVNHPDWLVVDHYGLDVEWEKFLRPHVDKVMVIDDLANRPHDCDILLDQNYTEDGERRYRGLVPDVCKLLIGPSFALLSPEYAAYRKTLRNRNGKVRRVLVFFGGSDLCNMTALALEALSAPDFDNLTVDVVIGANYQQRAALEQQASERPCTNLYGPRPHLADLMVQADIAIGAGGATTWERLCLGLPSIVITLAENQIPVSNLLAKQGLIRLIGHAKGLSAEDICESLRDEIKTRQYVLRSKIGMDVCDGTGILQLTEALLKGSKFFI